MEKHYNLEIDDSDLKQKIAGYKKQLENTRPLMNEIGELLLSSIDRNFQIGGRTSGKKGLLGGSLPWKPLSPVTIAQREKKGYWPGKILIQRGRLVGSLTKHVENKSVTLSAGTVYAATMQFGAKKGQFRKGERPIPWGDIPARPFMVIQKNDLLDIGYLIAKHILFAKK